MPTPINATAAAVLLASLAGCGAPPDTVRLALEWRVGDEWRPLPGAHVHAIALDAGESQLPLTPQALNELEAEDARREGITDRRGFVDLTVVKGNPAVIEVSAPPFMDLPDGVDRFWRWYLAAADADPAPSRDGFTPPTNARLDRR